MDSTQTNTHQTPGPGKQPGPTPIFILQIPARGNHFFKRKQLENEMMKPDAFGTTSENHECTRAAVLPSAGGAMSSCLRGQTSLRHKGAYRQLLRDAPSKTTRSIAPPTCCLIQGDFGGLIQWKSQRGEEWELWQSELARAMNKRIYLETTVVSYFTARPSRDLVVAGHQEATRDLWPRLTTEFETYVSALVFEEAMKGDSEQAKLRLSAIRPFRMLDIDGESRSLTGKILEGKGIPETHPEDALHIAIAAVNGVEVLLTWNFAHMNNPFTRRMIRQLIENAGYECPEICSPDELLEPAP